MKYPECLTVGIIAIGLVLGVIFQYDLCQARLWEVVGFVIFALSALIFGIFGCLPGGDGSSDWTVPRIRAADRHLIAHFASRIR